ncbi:MAG: glycosyltransferase family 2 protein [Rhodoferax sp.]|uniref:glycosyltransferase family 2 protein n=1 Tax=Rhodoferax sp. TaxID=50421 RepID=UPI002611B4D9|nr:glycosyltransferase family 2 protein [Rhodoferax sp.]MDD2880960.1 glycosyltransferase family 2 protein [Rhodoferax sp.]
MKNPLVSILIPVFNRENLIEKTINSALNQTVSDIEIIVIDNASTDATPLIVKNLQKKDKRIKFFENKNNIGPVLNWLKCANMANSKYAKILFSDDLIHESFLEKTLPYILIQECAFVYTPAYVGHNDWQGSIQYQAFLGDTKITRNSYVRISTFLDHFVPVSPGAALFRTSDLKNAIKDKLDGVDGYDFAKTGAGVDWLIYALISLKYSHISYVADPLVYFRAHPGSISIENKDQLIPMGYEIAKKWFISNYLNL